MFARSWAANSLDVRTEIRDGRLAMGSKGSPSSVRVAAASTINLVFWGCTFHCFDEEMDFGRGHMAFLAEGETFEDVEGLN